MFYMKKLTSIIKNGGIAVIKTDTLYGIVGLAKDQYVVDRIYNTKKRDVLKPVIVLVSGISDIEFLGIKLSDKFKEATEAHWPGKVSIIVPVEESVNLHYLHKGTGGIAFRVPDNEDLYELLKETGPLIAPSANIEGEVPANNIREAMAYFGDKVDYYEDRGECENCKASKIIKITDDFDVEVLRD